MLHTNESKLLRKEVRIFVSSPGDCAPQRSVIKDVLDDLNDGAARDKGLILQEIQIKKMMPGVGEDPQDVINKQLESFDILIGIMWMRFGTSTKRFGSGTEEEIRGAIARFDRINSPRIMLYFNDTPPSVLGSIPLDQYSKVKAFRRSVEERAFVSPFRETDEFRRQLRDHLEEFIRTSDREPPPREIEEIVPEAQPVPGADRDPMPVHSRDPVGNRSRRAVLEQIGPTYLLDDTYHFVDWNPLFEELVARPLKLTRGDHAEKLVNAMEKSEEVLDRAKQVFTVPPLVDLEELIYDTEVYGRITFQKIASQIADKRGNTQAWCVNLNVMSVDKAKLFWADVREILIRTVNWARYAVSYDPLLLSFDAYGELVDLVTGKLGDAMRCADLGAGTGNCSLALLKKNRERTVWAIDSNEAMVGELRDKARGPLASRLYVVKGDIARLSDIEDEFFDGAVMLNVLYSVEDRLACLREAHRILQPGGVLALSTPHSETNVDALFGALKRNLLQKNKFHRLRDNWDDARQRHEQLKSLILKDSKDDIRRYLETTGFEIEDWHDREYRGAVVVVKAIRI